jgi:hypothetical protein
MPGQEGAGEDDELWRSTVLDMEMKICSKMLLMDERNFHCWNYRRHIADIYLKEIELRTAG